MSPIQEIPVRRIDGSETTLKDFAGRVLLVVNVASKCGLTPQYAGLESLYEKYQSQGLSVLGFPANNFGAQEPGSNQEIAEFCETRFAVKFPLFEKISVKGQDTHPLYQQLLAEQPSAQGSGSSELADKLKKHGLGPEKPSDVSWNFEKFLIDRHGAVVGRFAPDVTPESPTLTHAIEAELAKG